MKGIRIVVSLLAIAVAIPVNAQYNYYPNYANPAPPPAPTGQIFAGSQLDQLLAPIALYPDPLIAQILPAATQPSQLAVAANYLAQGGDPNQIDAQPWDSSVKAVAHMPEVLQQLNSNLEWASQIGQAYLNQPTDVMNSIQRLRADAMLYGNLQNTPEQQVVNDNGYIEILPVNPETVYVPEYNPGLVYYQPGVGLAFGLGFALGGWFNHDFDWHDHRIVVWDHDHPRPGNWWHERPAERRTYIARAPAWHPELRHAPARGHAFAARPVNGGDRGYAPHVEVRPQTHVQVNPQIHVEAPRPAPAPHVAVHAAPSHPSAFEGGHSAPEARAFSNRGAASRGAMSGGGGHPAGGGGHVGGGGGGHPGGGGHH